VELANVFTELLTNTGPTCQLGGYLTLLGPMKPFPRSTSRIRRPSQPTRRHHLYGDGHHPASRAGVAHVSNMSVGTACGLDESQFGVQPATQFLHQFAGQSPDANRSLECAHLCPIWQRYSGIR
jgi:hypothetical protein